MKTGTLLVALIFTSAAVACAVWLGQPVETRPPSKVLVTNDGFLAAAIAHGPASEGGLRDPARVRRLTRRQVGLPYLCDPQ